MRSHSLLLPGVLILSLSALNPLPAQTTTTAPSTRKLEDIAHDIETTTKSLGALISSPRDLMDPAKRKEIAPKALPLYEKIESLMQELGQANPSFRPQINARKYQILSMKAALGDSSSETALKDASTSTDITVANAGKTGLLFADWIRASQDSVEQNKILDRTEELAKSNPADTNVVFLLLKYLQFESSTPGAQDRITKIIREDLRGPLADRLKEQLDKKPTPAPPSGN